MFLVICIAKLLISRFSFVKQPPSVEKRKGFFFPPKHSHEKFFRNFFQIYPSDFLLIFWREFVMRGRAACSLPIGGGVSLSLLACWASRSLSFFRSSLAPALSLVVFLIGFRPCRWVVLVGGAGLPSFPCPSFPCPFLSSSILVGLLGCGLPCLIVQHRERLSPSGGSGLWKHLPTGQNGSK